jgi:hypothetical protein
MLCCIIQLFEQYALVATRAVLQLVQLCCAWQLSGEAPIL